jgi:hypothetical protein
VLGGSTTSCSLLEALTGRFGVSRERLGLIYRGERNGRLAKRMHSCVAREHVRSVETYQDPAVFRALSDADVLFLATDQREPVVEGARLRGVRDLPVHPMMVVDFNTLGSTAGVRGLAGVTLIDAQEIDARLEEFNRAAVSDPAFLAAAAEAGAWIDRRVGVRPLRARRPARALAGVVS